LELRRVRDVGISERWHAESVENAIGYAKSGWDPAGDSRGRDLVPDGFISVPSHLRA